MTDEKARQNDLRRVAPRGLRVIARVAVVAGIGLLALLGNVVVGAPNENRALKRVIDLWHQMRPEDREVLAERLKSFEGEHPEIQVRPLYKETEELRSGLVSAVLADQGPEIIYGPSDAAGLYHAMGALADMSPWFTAQQLAAFDPRAVLELPKRHDPTHRELVFVGDRYGNHLALVYNRHYIAKAPTTTDELIAFAKSNTVDEDGDGVPDRYGLVWNFSEPYFVVPFLTGFGGWVFKEPGTGESRAVPALDTPEMVRGFEFVASLMHVHHVLPRSADYESASSLFNNGRAAMIIDGDWSWQGYLSKKDLDAAVAPLPDVSETGRPMAPMSSPKGYSLCAFAKGQAAVDAMEVIRFLTSEKTQRVFLEKQRILPSRLALRNDPLVTNDPVMATSALQAERGRPMPTDVELRAVWDAMRPPYQLLMSGELDAPTATRRMQKEAIAKIEDMMTVTPVDGSRGAVYVVAFAIVAGFAVWQRRGVSTLVRDLRSHPLAYLLILPSMFLIFLTVVYPLAYNIVLSFSNMSLTNLRDWQIVGLHNYRELAAGRNAGEFWGVFGKTILWTAVNVFFHVTLGVLLAVTLNGPVRGKSIYRLLLIIPWAVPAYITALTWRGMFDEQFGSVNQVIRALGWVNHFLPTWSQLEPVNWLGQARPAFTACIIANVWLGFPFMTVIALGGLQGIPTELYEAARIDRASRWQQFRQITLPMLKPVLVPAITLGAVWTFNNLNVVWLVSNGGAPADQTHILVSYVYKAVFSLYQYGYGAALSMVIFLMLLVFSLVFLNRTRATEAAY